MKKIIHVFLGLAVIWLVSGCTTTKGVSPQEKRQAALEMRTQVLTDLYKLNPDARAQIAASPGYAVFSNANVSLLFASFGGGYGVAENKRLKQTVFMKMGEAGIGLGLGVKDFRAVFIFKTQESLETFIDNGWEFGGHVDAAAKAGDKGAAVSGEAMLNGVIIYQITESGLALQATLKGTKFWKDSDLNQSP
jgi:lipid-binding SYLF domain-containing protein